MKNAPVGAGAFSNLCVTVFGETSTRAEFSNGRKTMQSKQKSLAHCCRFQKVKAKTGQSPGNSPGPARMRLRLALARSATTNPPTREAVFGDRSKGGASENLAGRRLATEKRHRADTGMELTGLPFFRWGQERVAVVRPYFRDTTPGRPDTCFLNRMTPAAGFGWRRGGGRFLSRILTVAATLFIEPMPRATEHALSISARRRRVHGWRHGDGCLRLAALRATVAAFNLVKSIAYMVPMATIAGGRGSVRVGYRFLAVRGGHG